MTMMALFSSLYLGILLGGLVWIALLGLWLMSNERDHRRYPREY